MKNDESKNIYLIPYNGNSKRTNVSFSLFIKKVRECLNSAFSKRKKVYLSFLIIFFFFSLLGYFYAVFNPFLIDRIWNFLTYDVFGKTYCFSDFFVFSLPLTLPLALALIFGFTVLGTIFPFILFSAFSFFFGIINNIFYLSFKLYSFILILVLFSVLFLFIAVFLTETYIYSKNSFYGCRALFASKALINYLSFFAVSMLTILILLYIIFLFK